MSTSGLNVPRIPSLRTQSLGPGTGCPSWTLVSIPSLSSQNPPGCLIVYSLPSGDPYPLLATIPFCGNLLGILGGQGWGPQR